MGIPKYRLLTGTPPLPSSSNLKLIRLGKIAVDATKFHRVIKPDILKAAGKIGNFQKLVGKNPDIEDENIILRGTGPFKSKTFNTGLRASDFFP